MDKKVEDTYKNELENPSYISKCQKEGLRKKVKGFFLKEILPKLEDIDEIHNDVSISWDELLDKLINSKTEVNSETIEIVMEIALQQKIIEENLNSIFKTSKKL